MKKILMVAVLCLAVIRVDGQAAAKTVYVAVTGSNSNAGTVSAPFKTVAKCLSVMVAGDTCLIREGTYPENLGGSVTLPSGTSWTNAITVKSYPGEKATLVTGSTDRGYGIIDPAHGEGYYIWENIILDGAVNGARFVAFPIGGNNHPHHWRLQDVEIKNAWGSGVLPHGDFWEFINLNVHHNGHNGNQDHGMYLSGADNLVDGGQYHDNYAYGIQIYDSGSTVISRNTVRNARIFNNGIGGGGGLIISSGSDNAAIGNQIYNNGYTGLSVAESGSAVSNRVIDNVVYGNTGYGILIGAGSRAAEVRGNSVYSNGAGIVDKGQVSLIGTNSLNGSTADVAVPEVMLSGTSVSGKVQVTADASDNIEVTGVQFRVDGVAIGAEDTQSPYLATWDSATAPNGTHVLTAVARDLQGNQATSVPVNVTVQNSSVPVPTTLACPVVGQTVKAIAVVGGMVSGVSCAP